MNTTPPHTTRATDNAPGPDTSDAPPIGRRMRAIVQDRYGPPDVLELRNVERPSIAPDEVLVEVHAAGVDRGTWHLMTGQPYLIRIAGFGLSRPKQSVPGGDVAGRVVAIGADVTRFGPGDEVLGIARGSFAEYAVASQDKLAHKPANVSYEQAAVATVSGITALQALTDVGGLLSGQRVLVIGASGGVGTYAVQLATALGGIVTGVAGPRNQALVASLGAERVVDYTRQDVTLGDHRFDLILDVGGRTAIHRLRRVLTPTGTLVIVGGEGGNRITGGIGRQLRAMLLSPFTRQRLTTFISTEHHSFIDRLTGHLASGAVVPAIGRRFDLADAPEAIRMMEAGATSGKSVIVVRDASASM